MDDENKNYEALEGGDSRLFVTPLRPFHVSGGIQSVFIQSESKADFAFKIHMPQSKWEEWRFKPPKGVVLAGQKVKLEVHRKPGFPSGISKMNLLFVVHKLGRKVDQDFDACLTLPNSGIYELKAYSDEEKFDINVKMTHSFVLNVHGSNTIEELKQMIGQKLKTDLEKQFTFTFAGKNLDKNELTLDYKEIGRDANIFVTVRAKGGCKMVGKDPTIHIWDAQDDTKLVTYEGDKILPHGSYLLNPGSPDEEKLKKTSETLIDEVERCQALGIHMYNFHPGSSVGKISTEKCLKTVSETINVVLAQTESVILVVETMASQGSTVGGKFEELKTIINGVDDKSRVGICLDTCHIFATGYDIKSKKAYDKTMAKFDEIVGFHYLKAVHLNDSKGRCESHLDRHENIGKGDIGKFGFEHLMKDSRFDDIPLILETPEGDYAQEMILLHSF